jgi:hypothetical protein
MSAFKKMFKQQDTEDKDRPMSQLEIEQWERQKAETLKIEEARETNKARDWLHDRGICDRKLEGSERRIKLQAYMKTLYKPAPGKDWAHSIIESYEAGDYMHGYAYRLACDATHREPVKVDRGEPF